MCSVAKASLAAWLTGLIGAEKLASINRIEARPP